MAMQSTFSGDPRFKMSKTFLDDFQSENDPQTSSTKQVEVSEVQIEQKQQINILEKVLGKQIKTNTIHMEPSDDEEADEKNHKLKSNSLIVRYDPDNPEHYRYRKPAADTDIEEKPPPKLDSSKKKTENGHAEIENVSISTTKEYKIDRNFADRLRETAISGPQQFSLLANLGRKNVEIEKAPSANSVSAFSDTQDSKNLSKWQLNLMNLKKSHQENEEYPEDSKKQQEITTKNIKTEQKPVQKYFFLYPDDPRLKRKLKFCHRFQLEKLKFCF